MQGCYFLDYSFHSLTFQEKYPGCHLCDGTFGKKRYFTCDPDSGVFVALDKLMPLDDAEYKSPSKPLKRGEHGQANLESRPRDIVFPSFLKGKNDQSLQARTVDYLSTDQRVVTFLKDNDTPVRGTVRFIGEEKDASGRVLVGLELVGNSQICFILSPQGPYPGTSDSNFLWALEELTLLLIIKLMINLVPRVSLLFLLCR